MHQKTGAGEIYEPILLIKLDETKKCPRLLLNASIHSRPIKIVQADEETRIAHLAVKNTVTVVLGCPEWAGQGGHCNSRKHITPLWRVLLDSGSDGDIFFNLGQKIKQKLFYIQNG